MSSTFLLRTGRAGAIVVLCLSLVSCGGGSDESGGASAPPTVPTPAVADPSPAASSAPVGNLIVVVNDSQGKPLANAVVTVFTRTATLGQSSSNASGEASFADLPAAPASLRISARHAFGYRRLDAVSIDANRTNRWVIDLPPWSPVSVAILPARIPATAVSADRTELDVQITLVASAAGNFVPSSYGRYDGRSVPTPLVRFQDCWTWLDGEDVTAACQYPSARVTVRDYAWSDAEVPALSNELAGNVPHAALLLLDQSDRVAEYDPHGLRIQAARNFIQSARTAPAVAVPDQPVVAGFAGQGVDATWPPLSLPQPLWLPPLTSELFFAEQSVKFAAVDNLRLPAGGTAPVFEALRSAYRLSSTLVPAMTRAGATSAWKPAVVALLGGGDNSGLSETQRQSALASLRQLQRDSGIPTVLVAGRLPENSVERAQLAELAAYLDAPLILSGYPTNWSTGLGNDGQYTALGLAAQLLDGAALPTIKVTFRTRAEPGTTFASGELLRGVIFVESDLCPMGCAELPLHFAARIP